MRRSVAMVVLMGLVATAAAAQRANPPAAPSPGSPGTYRSAEELMAALNRAAPSAGGMTASAVSNTDQYRINLVRRDKPAGAIAHPGNTEVHYIIDGAGTLVTGGAIVRGAGANAATIADGVTRRVAKGDVVIIPANSPHWYQQIDGAITYLEVRFVAPTP